MPGMVLKKYIRYLGPLLGLFLLCLILACLSEEFFTRMNITNISRQISINALLSLGMLFPILTAGIDLSVGSILALSIMTMGMAIQWGVHPIAGILICIGLGAVLGCVNGLLLTRLRLPHPFISTLGTMNMNRGIALILTGAAPIIGFPFAVQYLGNAEIAGLPVSFLLVLGMYTMGHIFLTRTAIGRYIYAIGGNKEAARLAGIDVNRVLIYVYMVSGFVSGLAGLVLVGRVNSAFPLAGMGYELDAIAACIIGGASFFGGVGTVWGTLIGVFIIGVLRNGLNLLNISADLQMTVIGLVIIIAVYIDVLRRRSM